MAVTCPDGHQSEAEDYCDTCGLEIAGGQPVAPGGGAAPAAPPSPAGSVPAGPAPAASAPSLGPTPAGATECPNCGTPRGAEDVFCEVCGLDHASGHLPAAPAPPPAAAAASPAPSGWQITVTADRAWFDQQQTDPGTTVTFPDSVPARTIDLVGDVMSVGRRSERSGWYPQIDLGHPVDDTGVSRRHAELRRDGDSWVLVDTDSTNGTVLNDVDLVADRPAPLSDGDRINLGLFTCLTVTARAEAG